MAIPDIIRCLRAVGFTVPDDAFQCTIDDEENPTRISFALVTGLQGTIGKTPRRYLTQDEQALVRQAVILQRAGWRLSGSPRP
jgi:hypothetical protein